MVVLRSILESFQIRRTIATRLEVYARLARSFVGIHSEGCGHDSGRKRWLFAYEVRYFAQMKDEVVAFLQRSTEEESDQEAWGDMTRR